MLSRKVVIVSAIVVVVLALTLILILLLASTRTPGWQAALTSYLDATDVALEDIRRVWAAEAQVADQLPPEMLSPVPTGWTWEDIAEIPPPDWVRCIRLERRGGETTQQTLDEHLLVSYHDDGLYHAGWLVQEFRADVSQDERTELLEDVGCDRWERVAINTSRQ
ncbi:MAG: hypothetical protein ACP5JG_08955 [Anaerolineae bacterium]